MLVGVPKEIKPQENRVALTPAGTHALCLAVESLGVTRVAEWSKLPLAKLTKFVAGKDTLRTEDIDRLQNTLNLD